MRTVKTRITQSDQEALRKLLESKSGHRILAWLRENTPTRPQPGSAEHEYVFFGGKINGYEEYDYNLRAMAYAELDDLNRTAEEIVNENES